jgi:hypothetical protein
MGLQYQRHGSSFNSERLLLVGVIGAGGIRYVCVAISRLKGLYCRFWNGKKKRETTDIRLQHGNLTSFPP